MNDAPGTVRPALALLVAGAFFMEILDARVIAPAAPGTPATATACPGEMRASVRR